MSTIAAYLAEAAYVQGRDDEAAELTEISESHTASDDVTSYISWRSVRAKVAARRREGDHGEALAREAVAAAGETDWPHLRGAAYEALADVLMATGRTKDARKACRQALELYEAKGSVAAADALRARFET